MPAADVVAGVHQLRFEPEYLFQAAVGEQRNVGRQRPRRAHECDAPARRQHLVFELREARFGEIDRVVEFVLRQRCANAHFGQRAAVADLLIVGASEHAGELLEVAAQERRFGRRIR